MTTTRSAMELLRSLGLSVDGPVRWGGAVHSRGAGIFLVEADTPAARPNLDPITLQRWIERVPALRLDGERPTASTLAERLESFWLPAQTILYVGRTVKTLGPRVAALYATPLGDRRPHAGGHWLKTMRSTAHLRLWWAETEAPEEYEDALLDAFAAGVGRSAEAAAGDGSDLPWAVLDTPSGRHKATGLSGALLSDEDVSALARARGGGGSAANPATTSRRAPARAAPRTRTTTRRPAQPRSAAGAAPPTHLTAEGLAALERELERLVREERPAVIERVKNARELGDLRENADYEAARNEQSFLEGRVRDLEARIRTAAIIEAVDDGLVGLGSTVRLGLDDEELELVIVGSTEADPAAGKISQESPVGRALMGHREGDEVLVRTPGHESRYRVLSVS